jgi:hypothetical protein
MNLQKQADKLRQMNLFTEARDCYDKYGFFACDTYYSLVNTFSWSSATATSSVDWSTVNKDLFEYASNDDEYTPEEIFEAFYPREFYPEKYI